MGKVITLVIISVLLLGMPYCLEMSMESLVVDEYTHQVMKKINNLMSAMVYILSLSFLFKAMVEFTNLNEKGSFKAGINHKNKVNKPKKIIIQEEIKKNKEDIKSIVGTKEEMRENEFIFNLDFENTSLNSKLSNIEKVIHSILSLPVLEENTENKILVYSTQEKYVKQVYNAYISIPKELRDKKIKNSSATILAMEQLILLENGLIKIENELLNQQLGNLNIMNRFLQEKFPEQKSYIILNK